MIHGSVFNREAKIEIEVSDFNGAGPTVEAIIDTGYNGYLTLPGEIVARLGLAFAGHRSGTLADGSSVVLDVYLGHVNWHRQVKEVLIAQAAGMPLIGMSLLEQVQIDLDAVDGGAVLIDELPVR